MTADAEREMCRPTEGSVWAYYGQRAVDRKSTKDEPKHAIGLDSWSMLGGAMDTECGVIAAIAIGPWDPKDPENCKKCAKFVAGAMPMPADPLFVVPAVPTAAPVRSALLAAA